MADKYSTNRNCTFIGTSAPMIKIYNTIKRMANSHASVLITGESGTGKELCAQAIHHSSQRQHQPFIPLNCAAIPNELMESELFGHIKGAFTSADKNRKGAVVQADNGTLFLDEIGEMQIDLQAKLLRFVETGTYYSVGDSRLQQVNIRFVSAMNRDPLVAIKMGTFRHDLYYRLKVVSIILPPLRQRGEDVLLLAQHFLDKYSDIESKPKQTLRPFAQRLLLRYQWPGNVRQLQNMMHNIIIFNEGRVVDADIVNELLAEEQENHKNEEINTPVVEKPITYAKKSQSTPLSPFCKVERDTIEGAIAYCNGNVSKAALLLCISKSTVYNRLKCWKEWGRKCEACTKFIQHGHTFQYAN